MENGNKIVPVSSEMAETPATAMHAPATAVDAPVEPNQSDATIPDGKQPRGPGQARSLLVLLVLLIVAACVRGPILQRVAENHVQTGLVWLSAEKYQDALDDFLAATRLDAGNAQAWYQAGKCAEALKDDGKAAEYYRKSIAANPRYAGPLLMLGSLDLLAHHVAEARELLARYVKLAPKDAEGWMALGEAAMEAEDPKAAAEAAKEALRLKPDAGEVYIFLADVESQAGADDKVVLDDAARGLALEPKSPRGYLAKGRAELHLGQAKQALQDLTKGLSLSPAARDRPKYLNLQAQAAAQAGHPDIAKKYAEEASRLQAEQR